MADYKLSPLAEADIKEISVTAVNRSEFKVVAIAATNLCHRMQAD
jgi:hypothetical protein